VKFTKKLLVLLLCFAFVFSATACGDKPGEESTTSETSTDVVAAKPDFPADRRDASTRTGNNATKPLVISSGTMDGKFNPFYATSQYDVDVVDMTQIFLIVQSEKAEPVAGINENTYALSYTMTVNDDETESTYKFILKNGITFSDGTPVTGKDLLFNLYELLDPAYTGSSTLYSMDIKGLKSYRTQVLEESAAEEKEEEFATAALARVEALVAGEGTDEDKEAAWAKVKEYITEDSGVLGGYLAQGYTLADFGIGTAWPEDFQATAVVLGYMGNITCEDGTITAVDTNVDLAKLATYTEEEAIDLAYNYTKANMTIEEYDLGFGWTVVTNGSAEGASDASDMFTVFKADETAAYLEENKGTVKSISGITLDTVTEDGVERERLTVVINGVDPKAIWNFGFQVAPLKHYSTEDLASKANGVDAFGVDFASKEFQEQLKQKVVPIGAGPYIAADNEGVATTDFDEFFNDGVVNYVANDNFMLAAPKIIVCRYFTVPLGSELTSLQNDEVHYSDPNATTDNINEIANTELKNILVDNLGYGYIGMNSQLIPDLNARKALASALDVELALEYYTGGLATNIYRSMSRVSWAYPEDATSMYPFDETGEASKEFFLASESFKEVDGKIVNADGSEVKYSFVLPSDANDHPAGQIFLKAKEVLAKIGVNITIEVDTGLLNKLQNNVVAVWAAAWQATIDPDVFQTYYSGPENTSESPISYGLYWLYQNGTDEEKALLVEVNELIMQARKSLNVEERKPVYSDCLDKVLELCVEIPTYQRKNMYVYNSDVIDGDSLWQDVTPYKGPIEEIWNVSLK